MEHITVCICTNKRPRLLHSLLEQLVGQQTEGLFDFSISMVDNDSALSAKPIVDIFSRDLKLEIRYVHAPDKNLSYLRNLSLSNSRGQYVAFIDDDEYPAVNWLLLHYKSLHKYQADGVLGPVLPKYEVAPPRWIKKGKICERPRYPTGPLLDRAQTRMGNALIKRSLFEDPTNHFDLKFRLGGEDTALFSKLINKGHAFVWCDEAVVYEAVPAERLPLPYHLQRSRLIGFIRYSYYQDTRSGIRNILFVLKSCVAVMVYLLSLPFLLALGYHHFARQMIRIHYHKAIILSFLGALKIESRDI